MGFLTNFGDTIQYSKSEKERTIIKEHAKNFILTWGIEKFDMDNDEEFVEEFFEPMFGYEIEVHKVNLDDKEKKVQIDLSGETVIKKHSESNSEFQYQLEYGRWMLEGRRLQSISLS
jgi:hypothetical protein